MSNEKNKARIILMQQRLAHLEPSHLEIEDQSHLHAGHAGAQSGAGHFALTIASQFFKDKNEIARHRMIYAALEDLIPTEIHALSITTQTA